MSVIDLDKYPDGTEEVLLAIWNYEQAQKNKEMGNYWIKRRQIASRTSLDKDKVRYRLDQLVDDNYVTEDIVTEHNQRVNYYALPPDGKESAKAIAEANDVLGEIPEEIARQDLLKLTNEMAALRAEIEAAGFELDNVSGSKFKQDLDSWIRGSKHQWDKINRIDDDLMDVWDAVLIIQDELGIQSYSDELDLEPAPEEKDYSHLNE